MPLKLCRVPRLLDARDVTLGAVRDMIALGNHSLAYQFARSLVRTARMLAYVRTGFAF